MDNKKVYLGNDTAGYELKMKCIEYLQGKGIPYVDCGSENDPDIEVTRYPFFAAKVCNAVMNGEARCGVCICGTGIGISMTCNKFPGIRAALCNTTYDAVMTRRHNNANVICFGGKTMGEWNVIDMLEKFLNTDYDAGFHEGSLNLITEIEEAVKKGDTWNKDAYKITTGPLADAEIFDRSKG